MDKNRIQKFLSSTRVLQFVFFVAAVTLVTYFFPREGKFRYTFQEGKPWKYGLLTAPFDFPVYKDEAVIQQERDSIMLDFQPVFSHNESIEKKSVDDFEKALSNYTEMSIPPTLQELGPSSARSLSERNRLFRSIHPTAIRKIQGNTNPRKQCRARNTGIRTAICTGSLRKHAQ